MPEMAFLARWPDGSIDAYYSPSLVVIEYLAAGATYRLPDFVERIQTAMQIASDRVQVKYGFACPRAAATLARIEAKAVRFTALPDATVRVEAHGDAALAERG